MTNSTSDTRFLKGFTLFGRFHYREHQNDTLVSVLTLLAGINPYMPIRLANQMPKNTDKRSYFADSPEALYPGRPDLQKSYAVEVLPGWFVGTNENRFKKLDIICQASLLTDVEYGTDLKVYFGS